MTDDNREGLSRRGERCSFTAASGASALDSELSAAQARMLELLRGGWERSPARMIVARPAMTADSRAAAAGEWVDSTVAAAEMADNRVAVAARVGKRAAAVGPVM